ncbi:MAG: hypothetical protein IJ693_03700 [Bacteroidaceae bacterium]|nr:hypothetical protein [Bacteroidaceae bacterium]
MKKNLFYLSMLALVLTFAACSSDGEDVGDLTSSATSGNAPELRANLPHKALNLSFSESAPLTSLQLTETGKAIIEVPNLLYNAHQRRASGKNGNTHYIIGTYTIQGTLYIILDDQGNPYCELVVTIVPNTNKANVTINMKNGAEIDATEFEADVVEKIASDDVTTALCREWTVATTRLRHKGSVTGIKQFERPAENPASLNDILDYAKSVATINEHFNEDMVITSVEFTQAGTFCIFFENGEHYIGKWSWEDASKGYIHYDWDSDDMGNRFENGEAVFDVRQYKKTNYYTLTLGATITDSGKDYEVELSFYLSEK